MADDSAEDKTEAPSEKRRQEARSKGTVAKSTEVNSVLVLLAALYLLKIFGPWIMQELKGSLVGFLKMASQTHMEQADVIRIAMQVSLLLAKAILPIAGGILLVGMLANIVQVGFMMTFEPLIPKLEKLDPISGSKRLLSMRSIVEAIKNMAKLSVIGIVAYLTLKKEFGAMIMLGDASVLTIWSYTTAMAFKIILRIALVMIIIAILDIWYQRFDHEKKLKMSKQELKEEHKQMDGDPQVKSRIKGLQREMARRRMMDKVPQATVVVTNPTHIAIALLYEPSQSDAPTVIAKGKRLTAERIKKLAIDAGVPIVEDKPLARAMYDKIDVGFPIPMEFFTAVAEILAYVYRLKNRTAA